MLPLAGLAETKIITRLIKERRYGKTRGRKFEFTLEVTYTTRPEEGGCTSMNKGFRLKKNLLNNQGFTLIELLMVVIILGILAAIVVPQFSSSSTDAKESVLKSNLATIRGALELYALQHNEQYPTATTSDDFVDQLILYTDKSHDVTETKGSTHPYGPYLKSGFPKNPFHTNEATADQVYIDPNNIQIGTVQQMADKDYGWIFVRQTGEFIANHADYYTF